MACLASRIPYGEPITVERLKRIEEAEKAVRMLTGARLVRVRDHGYIARIEVGRDERKSFFDENVLDRVLVELRKLGYKYVTLDLYGYRSGSLDEVLPEKIVPGGTQDQGARMIKLIAEVVALRRLSYKKVTCILLIAEGA